MKKTIDEVAFHKSLIDNLYDGVYFVNADRQITYWNKGAERITGYPPEEIIGRFCHQNLLDHVTDDGQHLCLEGCPLLATIEDGHHREAQVHLRHADGYRLPVLVRTSPIYDEEGHITGAVEVFSNNQSLFAIKQRMDELEQDVYRDALTGIGNRKFMEIKLNTAISEFRTHQISFGVLFLDIDHFKVINDTYGHREGDRVLQSIARNMKEHLRSTDICGRWGGEEFVAILHNVNPNGMARAAEKLCTMISNSTININGEHVSVTASIGGALVCHGDTVESLIERADQRMYQSKQLGRNRVTVEG